MKQPPETNLVLTKQEAALRQIEAACEAFWNGDFDICITLSGAAEGMAPEPDGALLRRLAYDPRRPPHLSQKEWVSILNQGRDWLKHVTPHFDDTIELDAGDAAHALMRAMQRWEPWSESMQAAKRWYLGRVAEFIESQRRTEER